MVWQCLALLLISSQAQVLNPPSSSLLPSLTAKLPEPTTTSPSVIPADYKTSHTSTPGPFLDPELAAVQVRTPDPVTYPPVERPQTAFPGQHGAPETEAVSVTLIQDFLDLTKVQLGRGDVLEPLQLPPLPTNQRQPPQLDISHGELEEDQSGSGQKESSGEGDSDDGPSGVVVTPSLGITPGPHQEAKTTSRPSKQISSNGVTLVPGAGTETILRPSQHKDEIPIMVPEIPDPDVSGEPSQTPAIVFKEDATPRTMLTSDLYQSPFIPVDGDTAKPPFHLIIVDIKNQSQSGKLGDLFQSGLIN